MAAITDKDARVPWMPTLLFSTEFRKCGKRYLEAPKRLERALNTHFVAC